MVDDNALNGAGVVYVVDRGNHCIRQLRKDGTLIKSLGSRGSGDGQLFYPYAIAKGVDGVIYVADWINHRIVAMRV